MSALPRIVITPGEPAGIGPDLACAIAQQAWPAELVVVADAALLQQRAAALGLPLRLTPFDPALPSQASIPGELRLLPVRSEEHTSELQSLMRISYAVFCLKKKIHSSDYPQNPLPNQMPLRTLHSLPIQ